MNKMYKVSILMGIYNCETTLQESVESILNQTYKEWELIMCDDCSSDGTLALALEIKNTYPEKIKLLQNDSNKGLNFTLNKCFSVASGKYLARQDGDDISFPERLRKQVDFLEQNPQFSIVSSAMVHFDESGNWGISKLKEYPVNCDFIHGTPFCHAASLFTREAFEEVKGYSVSEKLLRVEDYDLWSKMYALGFRGANLMEPLYKMRDDRNAYSRRKFKFRINEARATVLAIRRLKLPFYKAIFAVKPLVIGLLPKFMYNRLHKMRLKRKMNN